MNQRLLKLEALKQEPKFAGHFAKIGKIRLRAIVEYIMDHEKLGPADFVRFYRELAHGLFPGTEKEMDDLIVCVSEGLTGAEINPFFSERGALRSGLERRADTMTLYTIYRFPKDFPDKWVVRAWHIRNGEPEPDPNPLVCETLQEARSRIPECLVRIKPKPGEDPVIFETWI